MSASPAASLERPASPRCPRLQVLAGAAALAVILQATFGVPSALASNTPPVVAITSPTAGASVKTSGGVAVAATAKDADGIHKVEFLIDGRLVKTELQAPYAFTYSGTLTTGTHTITAKAYDRAGGTAVNRITVTAGGQTATVDVAVLAPLTVTLAGNGAGGVASGPAGVSCNTGSTAGCAGTFAPGTNVTLTATPDGNSTFTGWSGDCTGTAPCTVSADRARAVTATFGRRRVALSVTVGGNGGTGDVLVTGGNVAPATPCAAGTCAYTVDAGVTVNINARPATGSLVGTWSDLCAGTSGSTCSKILTADAAAGVTFTARDLVNVTATSSTGATLGGTFDFQGTVNGNPTQPIAIVISTANPQTGFAFDQTSAVTIRFAPNAASRLVSWGGVCQGTAVADQTGLSSCTFTSAANTSVVINLAPR